MLLLKHLAFVLNIFERTNFVLIFLPFVLILVHESSVLWTTEKLLHKLQPCGEYVYLLSCVKLYSTSLWKKGVVFLGDWMLVGCTH